MRRYLDRFLAADYAVTVSGVEAVNSHILLEPLVRDVQRGDPAHLKDMD